MALLRPRHWIQNSFVLAPLVFSGYFLRANAVREACIGAALFCLATSTTYIVNDLYDHNRDHIHRKKSKTRPLASGQIPVRAAWLFLIALYAVLLSGFLLIPAIMPILLGYILLNLAYTYYLKNAPPLDIFTVATSYLIRVYAGALAISAPPSPWMFVTTLALALFLVSINRRQEIIDSPTKTRESLKKYSADLLDRYAEMSATGALVFYGLFVILEKPQLIVTFPLVVFGMFRYWLIADQRQNAESPTDALLEDKQLLATIVLWVSTCVWALWPA
ncbi:MAG: decaprenyl-phosphate phosphoribosyltransferase [Bdellovibrionales bacterium]